MNSYTGDTRQRDKPGMKTRSAANDNGNSLGDRTRQIPTNVSKFMNVINQQRMF